MEAASVTWKQRAIEVAGWYGVVAILLAYALISFEFIAADSLLYQLLNLTGSLGLLFVSVVKKAMQPAALNIAWILIALVAIVGIVIGSL